VGPDSFDYPQEWQAYAGHYRNESPWIGSTRIVIRKGPLWLDGTIPIEADGKLFRLRDNPFNTEWIRISGSDLWRVAAA
jgi:hypothetical protein